MCCVSSPSPSDSLDLDSAIPGTWALLLALAWQAARSIRTGIADRPAMTKAIEMTLGIHTIGSIWLTGCALFLSYLGA